MALQSHRCSQFHPVRRAICEQNCEPLAPGRRSPEPPAPEHPFCRRCGLVHLYAIDDGAQIGLAKRHLAGGQLVWPNPSTMLASIASRRAAKAAAVDERLGILEKEAHEADDRLRRLYKLVEGGVAQGYWNGARPPFGFQAVEVERRCSRIKNRLAIDPVEAETVRLIFRLSSKATAAQARWGSRPLPCGSTSAAIAPAAARPGALGRSTQC